MVSNATPQGAVQVVREALMAGVSAPPVQAAALNWQVGEQVRDPPPNPSDVHEAPCRSERSQSSPSWTTPSPQPAAPVVPPEAVPPDGGVVPPVAVVVPPVAVVAPPVPVMPPVWPPVTPPVPAPG